MNAIYELRPGEEKLEEKIREGRIPNYLIPSDKIREVAKTAASMSTTLWFTKKEFEGETNMLNSVIACGQFNTCWNLLEYIEKIEGIKLGEDNTTPNHQVIIDTKSQLMKHWEKFQENPFWMVEKWNKNYFNK